MKSTKINLKKAIYTKIIMIRYIAAVLISMLYLVSSECPSNGGAALQPNADLLSCNATTLRKFYAEDACCIVNLAECNNIERCNSKKNKMHKNVQKKSRNRERKIPHARSKH